MVSLGNIRKRKHWLLLSAHLSLWLSLWLRAKLINKPNVSSNSALELYMVWMFSVPQASS